MGWGATPERRSGRARPGGTSEAALVIEVDETTLRSAAKALAHTVRRESGARVVAITGSTLQTKKKALTAEFLETRYRVIP